MIMFTTIFNSRSKWEYHTVGSLDFSVSKSKKSVEVRRAIHPEDTTDKIINRHRRYLSRLVRKGYSVYQMGIQFHYKGNENPANYFALVENLPYRR